MATYVPGTPPPILDRSLQQALMGFAQPFGQGLAVRGQQRALQQFAQQQGIDIPRGLPPGLAQQLIAQTFDPFGIQQGRAGLIGAQTEQIGVQQPFTLPPGAQRRAPGGELIAEAPFRPTAPRAPTAFEQTSAEIDRLAAIPKAQRTPTEQARLDQLLARKPKTAAERRLGEIDRLEAIPEKTPAQQNKLAELKRLAGLAEKPPTLTRSDIKFYAERGFTPPEAKILRDSFLGIKKKEPQTPKEIAMELSRWQTIQNKTREVGILGQFGDVHDQETWDLAERKITELRRRLQLTYRVGSIVPRGNKKYRVVGFDMDGEPLVEEIK